MILLNFSWFDFIGAIFMVSMIPMALIFKTSRDLWRRHKKHHKIFINGLDILFFCAIPEAILFTWRRIAYLLNLCGTNIIYDKSALFPEINDLWIRIFILAALILSVVGATMLFFIPDKDEDDEEEKEGDENNAGFMKKITNRIYFALIVLLLWVITGLWALRYVISWIS